jgi:hypothetical protein
MTRAGTRTATTETTGGTVTSVATDRDTDAGRWAGPAGIAFAVSVAVQNVWAGAAGINPANDAPATSVLAKFAEHADAHGVLSAWVGVNLVLIGLFLAGAHARLRRSAPAWANLGLLGGVLLMALFALVNVPRVALALGADGWQGEPALVDALWDLHLATFAYAGIALGLALLGFSLAAVSAGMVPRWFRIVGPVGAAAIIAFSVPVQAAAAGSEATMGGALGFVAWLAFLVVFGVRLWRDPADAVAAG